MVERSKRKGNRYTENFMSHNFFIISLLKQLSYGKVMTADVRVPYMRCNAGHNFFIMSRLVQQNYDRNMTPFGGGE